MPSILLQGRTVILLDDHGKLYTEQHDVLIENDIIIQIGENVKAPFNCDIIDCKDKIISPGFVDTHRHMWETALKGLCEDLTCVSYFAQMFTSVFTFTPEDIAMGTVAGCIEAIEAGTTTILDFAHMNWTKDHAKHAISGTLSSGIRSVFALAPTVTLKATAPPTTSDEGMIPAWFMPLLKQLSQSSHLSSPLSVVSVGLGFDYFFLPKEVVLSIFAEAKSYGVQTVTSHWARFPGQADNNLPALLRDYGVLDSSIVLSHIGGASKHDADIIKKAGAFVSASPTVEMTMGLGPPVCFRDDLDLDSNCSLGVDSHHATSGSMVSEMRVALLAARGRDVEARLASGTMPDKVCRTAHDAFIMATIQGARALRMEDKIGNIAVGKKADVAVFNATSPAMIGAAQRDPVTAIVIHSSVADVDTVIVNGSVKKRNGKMLPITNAVAWDENKADFVETQRGLAWGDIANALLDTQKRFTAKLPQFDMESLRRFTRQLYGFPEI